MSSVSTETAPSITSTFSNSQPTASSNQGNGNTTSSSLYLFTFLATLLLLLAVSCAIVARSLVIRRRFRRRVEEAIAAGFITPQQATFGAGLGVGGRRRDIGQKPTLWDSWLAAPGEAKWSEIKPVSVKVISEKLTGAGLPRETNEKNGRSSSTSPHERPRRRLLSAIPFPLTYRQSPAPPSQPDPKQPSNPEPKIDDTPAELQVAVLIAMPSPYRPQAWSAVNTDGTSASAGTKGKERSGSSMDMDGEDDLPDVVFGVTEVPWKPPMHTEVGSEDANSSLSNNDKTA